MCCSGFLKVMMFIFNGGIFLAGAGCLGMGIWLKVDSGSLLGLLEGIEDGDGLDQLVHVAYVLIGVGAALVIIGFLGCCGAVKESRCMLLTFFCIVLVIFIVEVAGAIVLFAFDGLADKILDNVENEVRSKLQTEFGRDESLTSVWESTMEQFKCCGYRNYTDFTGSPFNTGSRGYPFPCCDKSSSDSFCSLNEVETSDVPGCFEKLKEFLEENALIVAGVALGIAALEIAAMVVSMILYKKAGKRD
uniref:Tetraspanin n=1 Tax=Oryzias latipes TaxID=8090 RepID=A0A3P9HIX6_ORYLA